MLTSHLRHAHLSAVTVSYISFAVLLYVKPGWWLRLLYINCDQIRPNILISNITSETTSKTSATRAETRTSRALGPAGRWLSLLCIHMLQSGEYTAVNLGVTVDPSILLIEGSWNDMLWFLAPSGNRCWRSCWQKSAVRLPVSNVMMLTQHSFIGKLCPQTIPGQPQRCTINTQA